MGTSTRIILAEQVRAFGCVRVKERSVTIGNKWFIENRSGALVDPNI